MPEYIEREKVHRLVRSLNRYAWSNPDRSEYRPTVDIDEVQFGIDKIPAADVVEVVRCKDCAIPHNRFTGCPKLNGLIPPENHFCSFGERKEGDAMSNNIKTGEIVMCVDAQFYGVSGVIINQYCPTGCEEQTMIRCIDGREFHAPTRCFIKAR